MFTYMVTHNIPLGAISSKRQKNVFQQENGELYVQAQTRKDTHRKCNINPVSLGSLGRS